MEWMDDTIDRLQPNNTRVHALLCVGGQGEGGVLSIASFFIIFLRKG